eukprot:11384015-Karenia_brevis.AAC.1
MIRRPPRSPHCVSSAASDVYKRQHTFTDMFLLSPGDEHREMNTLKNWLMNNFIACKNSVAL